MTLWQWLSYRWRVISRAIFRRRAADDDVTVAAYQRLAAAQREQDEIEDRIRRLEARVETIQRERSGRAMPHPDAPGQHAS